MTTGLLLILQIILYHMTAAAVYNYDETSEEIPFGFDPNYLSGFRNITNKDFIIGGLFPVNNCRNSGLQDLEMLEAMLFAIDRINNDMNLLPNLTIGYDVRDTCNDNAHGLYEVSRFRKYTGGYYSTSTPVFLGIVGPANTNVSYSVANLARYFQIPLISYASSDAVFSHEDIYEYFLRTIPSDNLQTDAMVDLVSFFGWEYVSMIFNDNDYGYSASNAFIDVARQHNIYINAKIEIPPSGSRFNKTIVKAAISTLLNSTVSVVIVFADEDTVLALFEELNKTNSTHKFVWIASDRWANSQLVHKKFPEIANRTFGFQLHTKHVKEFADYFSQLTSSRNVRDKFFPEYYKSFCIENGTDCPNGVTSNSSYTQGDIVPFVIDAVYAFAHALQNFLNNNCDSPLRWDRTTQQCDGMKHNITGPNLLGYLYNCRIIRDIIITRGKTGLTGTTSVHYKGITTITCVRNI